VREDAGTDKMTVFPCFFLVVSDRKVMDADDGEDPLLF
jgi:hypothetical protein